MERETVLETRVGLYGDCSAACAGAERRLQRKRRGSHTSPSPGGAVRAAQKPHKFVFVESVRRARTYPGCFIHGIQFFPALPKMRAA